MKIDTSDYYPWDADRKRPAEKEAEEEQETEVVEETTAPVSPDLQSSTNSGEASIPEDNGHAPQHDLGFITILAHMISVVLSPVIIPTLGMVALFTLSMLSYAPTNAKLILIAVVFVLTCVVPCAAILVLRKFGNVKDVALSNRSDRLFPYIVMIVCMVGCGLYLTKTGLPLWVGYFYIGAGVAIVVNLIVNIWWKISAHGAGMGGLIAMFLLLNRYGLPPYNLYWWVIAAVIAGGVVGAARVWLGRHTPMQTICGEIVGFASVMITEMFV